MTDVMAICFDNFAHFAICFDNFAHFANFAASIWDFLFTYMHVLTVIAWKQKSNTFVEQSLTVAHWSCFEE